MAPRIVIQLFLSFLIGAAALSISNPYQNHKRGLTVSASRGSDAKAFDGYGKYFDDSQLKGMKVYWYDDGIQKKSWDITEMSRRDIMENQAEMHERAKIYGLSYQAESVKLQSGNLHDVEGYKYLTVNFRLQPQFDYTDDWIWNPKAKHKSVDYNPANAGISVGVRFVPPQTTSAEENLKERLRRAMNDLTHERNEPVYTAVNKLLKATSIRQIVGAGLGTTQQYSGIAYDHMSDSDSDLEEDVLSEDDRPWIQNALVVEAGQNHGKLIINLCHVHVMYDFSMLERT